MCEWDGHLNGGCRASRANSIGCTNMLYQCPNQHVRCKACQRVWYKDGDNRRAHDEQRIWCKDKHQHCTPNEQRLQCQNWQFLWVTESQCRVRSIQSQRLVWCIQSQRLVWDV